ncbi:MAG TPA: RluA family pseudouridine synthase [Longimicrobiaceae bacterium]|nr:RluA family pseudouridine synthase [Longimicrobiaceae bacterium]
MHSRKRQEAERWVEHSVTPEEAGRTVQQLLTGTLGLSRRLLQKLSRSKGFRLNDRATFLARTVKAGDRVAARVAAAEETGLTAVPMPLDILHEDEEILVVNKPPALLVHPTSARQARTLAHGIAHHFQQQGVHAKVRPVHRIDRDTSGLVLFAKSAVAHQRLDRQLRERALRREYLALVDGVIERQSGVIEANIGRHSARPNLRAVRPTGGEHALTRFQVVERFPAATLLQVELETGRTHQIRVHLMHIGHPVLGDREYGGAGMTLMPRQALHAWRLSFSHPRGGDGLRFEAPLPADIAAALDQLRRAEPGR